MKKLFFLCCMFLFTGSLVAREGYIQSRINRVAAGDFVKHSIFAVQNKSLESFDPAQYVSDFTIARVFTEDLQNIVKKNDYAIELEIPYNNQVLVLQLIQSQAIKPRTQFTREDQDGKTNSGYKPGAYYSGVVKGISGSVAAISFFENDIIGTVALPSGNLVIGKSDPTHIFSEEYIIYNDRDLKIKNNFACLSPDERQGPLPDYTPSKATRALTINCVNIYVECDYKLYQDFQSNVTNATNFASGLLNIVSTLYLNDSITIAVSQINVWTVSDPYDGAADTGDALDSFSNQMSGGFNGDLAHLLSRRNIGGGIAWLDVLCASAYYRCGVSASLSTNLTPLPTYSWNSMVVTHETGHNMASPHTHACAWNGNNTRIDNCAGNYNILYQEGVCVSNPPDPPQGGTIMSYCHLSPYGINLSEGFGPQPGALIRNTINAAGCLGACENCDQDIIITGVQTDTVIESTTWIQATGQTTISSSATVKLDPEPLSGYFLAAPGVNSDYFVAAPDINGEFVAQAYDGCSGLTPAKPQQGNEEESNALTVAGSDGFLLFPNPANGMIQIQNSQLPEDRITYQVLSVDGKILYSEENVVFNNRYAVSLNELPAGLYFMKIQSRGRIQTLKFQKN